MLILAVDQGFEHGPIQSFGQNMETWDPLYHMDFAVTSGFSGFAAPLGFLEMGADRYAGQIPLILKLNSSSLLNKKPVPDQAITSTVKDAVRLGCAAVGFTIYPGSAAFQDQLEELQEVVAQAKEQGIPTIVWSYPRGDISKAGETALDIVAYGAHMACLMGAHIVKVKIPTAQLEIASSMTTPVPKETVKERLDLIAMSCFAGKRLVIFSGGERKGEESLLEEIQAVHNSKGHGSIIGRNIFQRSKKDALMVVQRICAIYKSPQA